MLAHSLFAYARSAEGGAEIFTAVILSGAIAREVRDHAAEGSRLGWQHADAAGNFRH